MTQYDPHKHHRRSIRVPGYDYTHGWFFVTVCSYQRQPLFGRVVAESVQLSPLGALVVAEWEKTAVLRTAVVLDAYVVMPNHLHAIIALDNDDTNTVGASRRLAPTTISPQPGSLGAIMAQFKSIVTKTHNRTQQATGIRIWQRGYYERIIRNEHELNAIRDYNANNPARWAEDRENLDRLVSRMEYRSS